MKVKEAFEKLKEYVDEIVKSGKFGEWLKFNQRTPYSPYNTIMLFAQAIKRGLDPFSTDFRGMKTWNKAGRKIIKGQHGFKIITPILGAPSEEYKKDWKEKHPNEECPKEVLYGFKTSTVFDVSQTEGTPLPEPPICKELTASVKDFKTICNAIEAIAPCPVQYREIKTGAKGSYNLVNKIITVNKGMSESQTIKTLLHEITHARLHQHSKRADYELDEVQAESVAYLVCDHFGIDSGEYSPGYIAAWSGKDLKYLSKSGKLIKQTAETMIADITDQLESVGGEVLD